MSATSRELVIQTLNMDGPMRAPRSLRVLPLAAERYVCELDDVERDYPVDVASIEGHERGGPYAGAGYKEWLNLDADAVNRDCASTDKFTVSTRYASPFEQLQHIRGAFHFLADLLDPPREMLTFMREMHAFYVELLTCWSRTDVDCLYVVDDWGSERSLLISPSVWREHLKPMYRDYVQIAHDSEKKILFHSDGNILEIFPDLIEIGVDAVNSQIFRMGLRNLWQYAGKITFWGDMDQGMLEGESSTVDQAVKDVYTTLWTNGGCIAQCEFGPGAKPQNLHQMFITWDTMTRRDQEIPILK